MKIEVDITRSNPGNIEIRCKTAADADMLEIFLRVKHGHKVTRTSTDRRIVFLHDPGRDFVPASELGVTSIRSREPQKTLEEVAT